MKKIVLMVCVMVAVGKAIAQTSSGSMMIGGSFGIVSEKQQFGSNDATTTTYHISPSFGYFLSDNFAIGGYLGYAHELEENTAGVKTRSTGFLIGPFARLYKFTSNERFAFIGEASFLFGSGKIDPDGPGETRTSTVTLAISPGFAYFFSDRWALDFTLTGIAFQSHDPNKDVDDNTRTTILFGVSSLNPSLGFRYFF